jgi:hypothetical protein
MKITVIPSRLLVALPLVLAAAGLAWWTSVLSVAPWVERERRARAESAALKTRLEEAHAAIQKVRDLESDAQAVRRQIDQLAQEIPPGSATVWLPELVKEHFPKFGMNDVIVRMNTIRDVPELPGFHRGYWSVGVPLAETPRSAEGALLAVAEIEQQHPLVKVLDFAIRPDPEHPQGRVALLNVSALIRK